MQLNVDNYWISLLAEPEDDLTRSKYVALTKYTIFVYNNNNDIYLHNEEINVLYSSPNIVRVIKSRRMRWAGHVARMGEDRGCIGSWWGNQRERDHWGDLGVGGLIILGWISRRWDVGMWTGSGWPRIGTGGGRL